MESHEETNTFDAMVQKSVEVFPCEAAEEILESEKEKEQLSSDVQQDQPISAAPETREPLNQEHEPASTPEPTTHASLCDEAVGALTLDLEDTQEMPHSDIQEMSKTASQMLKEPHEDAIHSDAELDVVPADRSPEDEAFLESPEERNIFDAMVQKSVEVFPCEAAEEILESEKENEQLSSDVQQDQPISAAPETREPLNQEHEPASTPEPTTHASLCDEAVGALTLDLEDTQEMPHSDIQEMSKTPVQQQMDTVTASQMLKEPHEDAIHSDAELDVVPADRSPEDEAFLESPEERNIFDAMVQKSVEVFPCEAAEEILESEKEKEQLSSDVQQDQPISAAPETRESLNQEHEPASTPEPTTHASLCDEAVGALTLDLEDTQEMPHSDIQEMSKTPVQQQMDTVTASQMLKEPHEDAIHSDAELDVVPADPSPEDEAFLESPEERNTFDAMVQKSVEVFPCEADEEILESEKENEQLSSDVQQDQPISAAPETREPLNQEHEPASTPEPTTHASLCDEAVGALTLDLEDTQEMPHSDIQEMSKTASQMLKEPHEDAIHSDAELDVVPADRSPKNEAVLESPEERNTFDAMVQKSVEVFPCEAAEEILESEKENEQLSSDVQEDQPISAAPETQEPLNQEHEPASTPEPTTHASLCDAAVVALTLDLKDSRDDASPVWPLASKL